MAMAAHAQTPPGTSFPEGTAVVIVGEITSQPRDLGVSTERKMQVAIGPGKVDYTLHLRDAKMYGVYGQEVKPGDFSDKMWVRAEGKVMDDPRRIKVSRLQVVGKDLAGLKQTAFYRPGFDQGYVMAVAGTRQIFPVATGAVYEPTAMTIVGKVSSDTGTFETTRKIQVDAAGNTWSLSVPSDARVMSAKGEKISVHEISDGQWVRAHGWQTDDLRMRVARMENIGKEEAYRASTFFRAGEPIGYVDRAPGTAVRFMPLRATGTITAVDQSAGTVTLRDESGKDRVYYLETITVWAENRPVMDTKTLRSGQRVTVQGSEIQF
jgi:hypothetical protein